MSAVALIDLDYLVYSSHKTATQTLVNTLTQNGYNCRHCHFLRDIGMSPNSFVSFLDDYFIKHQRQLEVITTFRDPIERHVSSFFQWYGSKPVRDEDVESEFDTIIYKNEIHDLQSQFIDEINNVSLIGQQESIDELCKELGIGVVDLSFDFNKQYGIYETEKIKIYIFRFDLLVTKLVGLLSLITDHDIELYNSNLGNAKWYHEIYSEFKKTLKIPRDTIDTIYSPRKDLVELFYQDNYDSIVRAAHKKYGVS